MLRGLISKHFIYNESWAGGVYQWERIEDAHAFYSEHFPGTQWEAQS
jgi:hypothetical protein